MDAVPPRGADVDDHDPGPRRRAHHGRRARPLIAADTPIARTTAAECSATSPNRAASRTLALCRWASHFAGWVTMGATFVVIIAHFFSSQRTCEFEDDPDDGVTTRTSPNFVYPSVGELVLFALRRDAVRAVRSIRKPARGARRPVGRGGVHRAVVREQDPARVARVRRELVEVIDREDRHRKMRIARRIVAMMRRGNEGRKGAGASGRGSTRVYETHSKRRRGENPGETTDSATSVQILPGVKTKKET